MEAVKWVWRSGRAHRTGKEYGLGRKALNWKPCKSSLAEWSPGCGPAGGWLAGLECSSGGSEAINRCCKGR